MNGTRKARSSSTSEISGVTIVSPTIRPQYMRRILDNYARQQWAYKELIVVLNRDSMSMKRYLQAAEPYPNVRIIRMPDACTIGDCLNKAASFARYPFIAKFDDDDYYGPGYIAEAVETFENTDADVVGKTSFFFYFPHRRALLLRERPVRSGEETNRVAGATIMFRSSVLHSVQFGKRRQGSDVQFIQDCRRRGLSVVTSSPYNFAAFRRADRQSHTWKVAEQKLFADPRTSIIQSDQYWQVVDRQPDPWTQLRRRAQGILRLRRHR